jgi:broad specificity phosphatase PhoE
MTTTQLLLIRHGESEGNVAAATASRERLDVVPVTDRDADVPLSATGVEQATSLGLWLRGDGTSLWPGMVFSSPYLRAHQTAELAFGTTADGAHGASGDALTPLLDERLRDRELGVLDTLTGRGIVSRFPQEAERRRWLGKFYYRPPGGESWADLALRVRSFLLDLEVYGGPERVAVVCHDAVVLVFRYVCEGYTEEEVLEIGRSTPVMNTGVTLLSREPGARRWSPTLFNSTEHLEQHGAPVTQHGGDRDVFSR